MLLFSIPYERKGGPNCSEQGSYNFTRKKRTAEEAKPKDPAVSYQRNHYLKELVESRCCIRNLYIYSFN